jgi:hypothetical protein
MVLHYYGYDTPLAEVADAISKPSPAAFREKAPGYFPQLGFSYYYGASSIEQLVEELGNGHPVVIETASHEDVAQTSPNEPAHARVVVGFDESRRIFYVHDPETGPWQEFSYERVENLWRIVDELASWSHHNIILIVPRQ